MDILADELLSLLDMNWHNRFEEFDEFLGCVLLGEAIVRKLQLRCKCIIRDKDQKKKTEYYDILPKLLALQSEGVGGQCNTYQEIDTIPGLFDVDGLSMGAVLEDELFLTIESATTW